MFAAYSGYIKYLPLHFYHDSTIRDSGGYTVAMRVVRHRHTDDLPVEFRHSSLIKNKFDKSIIDFIVDD